MPFKPDLRTYRSFAASNFKPIQREVVDSSEADEEKEPSYRIRGYFTTFNEEYELYPQTKYWPAEYEQISPNAFDECDTNDVIMQYDHSGDVLARTRNGSLTIGFDDHGGYCEADLGGCQRARDLYESVANGLVVEMSFGFLVASDKDSDGYTYTRDEDGTIHTTITRISKLFDVSIVSIPANPGTDVENIRKRSLLNGVIEAEQRQQELLSREREVSKRRRRAIALRLASLNKF